MKVVHLCVTDEAGAGMCCRRIHHALQKEGVESYILSMLHFTDDPDVVLAKGGVLSKAIRGINKLLYLLHLPLTDVVRVKVIADRIHEPLSMPVSTYKNLCYHPLIQEADIIHFHSVGGFVDLPSFLREIQKPIVWTLHDEHLFFGLCHYERSQNKVGALERKYYSLKLHSIQSANKLGVVFLSSMMNNKYHAHEMVAGRKNIVINNPVDANAFKPIPKSEARKKLELAENDVVFAFTAMEINDRLKGLQALSVVVSATNNPSIKILAIGKNTEGISWPHVVSIGPKYGATEISEALSAADYYALPSYQEAFSQSPLEAMACGLPVVMFPVSGASDLINDRNGVVCEDFTSDSLRKGIEALMSRKYDSQEIRQDMINRFSPQAIAQKYIDFYKSMLEA